MTLSTRERARVNISILLLSAITWMMLLVTPGTVAHCAITESGASMNSISSLTWGWALMLVAMMSPTLISPIHHVRQRSFKRRRVRSVTLFVVGYVAIWMGAGAALIAAMLMLKLLAPNSYLPAVEMGIIAFVWQCSPMKQRCLNRGHNHRELAAFGINADLDALRFGITHGVWCVGSCWALMLFVMLLSEGHFLAMAAVTFLIISERLEQPKPLIWRLRLRGKLMRILIAQTRIRLHGQL